MVNEEYRNLTNDFCLGEKGGATKNECYRCAGEEN